MICPYCRTPIDADPQSQKICEGCATPHHPECFAENGGCTLFGCKFAPPDEPKLQVATQDVARLGMPAMVPAAPAVPYSGFGDVQAPRVQRTAPAPPAVAPPPPPPPPPPLADASAPLAAATAAAPAMSAAPVVTAPAPATTTPSRFITPGGIFDAVPDAAGNMVANVHPKNRLAFILLGIVLGIFGAHNFYAGYYKTAIIQLCLTVLSFFFAAPVTAVWAIVEVCTVDRDSRHVEFN